MKYLINKYKSDTKFIKSKGFDGNNILHSAVRNKKNVEIIKLLFKEFKSDQEFIKSKGFQ